MLRVTYLSSAGVSTQGGEELIASWREGGGLIWVDLEAPTLDDEAQGFLSQMGCHPLAIRDAGRARHPPKLEEFSEHMLIIFRAVERGADHLSLRPLQLSFFVHPNALITVRSAPTESVERLWADDGLSALLCHPERLTLSIMHHLCGLYLEALLSFDEDLQLLEDQMITQGSDLLLKALMRHRAKLRKLHRVFTYHEQVVTDLLRLWGGSESGELRHLTRDVYDRCERLESLSAQQYELCGDLVDGYLSLSAHQLNQTMKVLTAVTVIFVPLSFLAGVYGMNFDYIPELHVRSGYFILLGVMCTIACSMALMFKRRGWFA